MSQSLEIHRRLTPLRVRAYEELFLSKPATVFPYHRFMDTPRHPNPDVCVDVLVYPIAVDGVPGPVLASVTNGMSDYRMADPTRPDLMPRRELIQYFRVCTDPYARRLHDAAWLPHADRIAIDEYDTISWPDMLQGELQHSLFLRPIWLSHAQFAVELESDKMSFLWHIPITDAELIFKQTEGINALLDRMEAAHLPWLFDADTRPPLLSTT